MNAITLGLETSDAVMARFGALLNRLDQAILAVFVLELLAKFFAHGLRFFRQSWNVFDLVVVGFALVPAAGPLQVLRTLRVLRVLRLIPAMPRLRFVVEALLHAVPGIGAIGGLLAIVFYVFAVMATELFGASFPDWFGSIGASLYTLFQIIPHAWLFFVPFILMAPFTMLNLFIAVIVNTMQAMQDATHGKDREHIEATVHAEGAVLDQDIRALRQEIRELKAMLATPRP